VLRTSHLVRTVTAVFDLLGLDYVAVGGPTYCCGIVHHQQGDTAAAAGMNQRTVELFQRYRPQEVVMWCPSCIYFYDDPSLRIPLPRTAYHRVPRFSVASHHFHGSGGDGGGTACPRARRSAPARS
jgi:heterodisulfide reductase subunit B